MAELIYLWYFLDKFWMSNVVCDENVNFCNIAILPTNHLCGTASLFSFGINVYHDNRCAIPV